MPENSKNLNVIKNGYFHFASTIYIHLFVNSASLWFTVFKLLVDL